MGVCKYDKYWLIDGDSSHLESQDRMVNVDIFGSFWPAARPDKRVPGRLTFDHGDGRRLDLS